MHQSYRNVLKKYTIVPVLCYNKKLEEGYKAAHLQKRTNLVEITSWQSVLRGIKNGEGCDKPVIRYAICDDEARALQETKNLIDTFMRNYHAGEPYTVEQFSRGSILQNQILDGSPFDIYLLDVEMPGQKNGLELAREIRQSEPEALILLLTSHVKYAIEGYKVRALRYVPKMRMEETLPEALEDAYRLAKEQQASCLTLYHYTDAVRIPYHEIMYVHRVLRSLEIVTNHMGTIRDNHGLQELMEQLHDDRFIRVERSYFVNIDFVLQVSGAELILKNGERLPISRKLLAQVKGRILSLWGAAV